MKESVIVKQIKEHLQKKYQAQCFKHHGGIYSEAGVADLICVIQSRFCAFECKRPGKKATPIQLLWMERYRQAGAIVGVVDSIESVDKLLLDNIIKP